MLGDYEGARPFYERALAIYEKVLGPEHPDTARSLDNLGALLKATGDYQGARPFYARALAIFTDRLGPVSAGPAWQPQNDPGQTYATRGCQAGQAGHGSVGH